MSEQLSPASVAATPIAIDPTIHVAVSDLKTRMVAMEVRSEGDRALYAERHKSLQDAQVSLSTALTKLVADLAANTKATNESKQATRNVLLSVFGTALLSVTVQIIFHFFTH